MHRGRDQLQVVLFEPFQRIGQILLLQAAEQHQVGNEENAAGGVLEHLVGQRRTRCRQIEPRHLRRLQGARADFGDAAGGALEQQDRGLGRGLFDTLPQILEQRRARKGVERDRRFLRRDFVLERFLDRRQQLLQRNRLFKEIDGADACRFDGRVDRSVAGHHHHRHVQQAARRPFLEQRDAIRIRHPDVEQHQVGAHLAADPARFGGVLGQRDAVPLVGQDLREKFANAHFIIDHQYFRHVLFSSSLYCFFYSYSDARRKRMLTSAPVGCRLLMRIRP